VIVKDARIIGRGWTQPSGRPHAETVALLQAGKKARGATAFVTLEPCAHHGQTPPCAQALIDAGIERVVVALGDPDPRVDGGGFAMLRAAGIQVTTGICADEACADLVGFLNRITHDRPFLTLKLAGSFDGRIATATGESQWITGPQARRHVHAMRACHDAVMVGAGTARADDPSLTVRDLGAPHQPIRVIVSRQLELALDSQLAKSARDIPVWICYGKSAPQPLVKSWLDLGANLIEVCENEGRLDPVDMLKSLGAQGLTRVYCEGGGALAASLLQAHLVDELVGYSAGLALGAQGRAAIGAMGIEALSDAPRFDLVEARAIGNDVLHRWKRR
jgi:diaminohydroxyphosphoribosylaminopyrimidine deaminase/5-amino-6-(5-phosphoribosylamino)uracil reductase